MTTTPRPPVWVSGRNGEAHARYGNLPRTVCGLPAIDERFAWPTREHCETCRRLVTLGDAPRDAA